MADTAERASLTTGKGTMLWVSEPDASETRYQDIYAQHTDGRTEWAGLTFWSSSRLQWRYAGHGYADLHSLMRDVAVVLEDRERRRAQYR